MNPVVRHANNHGSGTKSERNATTAPAVMAFAHSPELYEEAAVPCTNCLRRFCEGDIKHVCGFEVGKMATSCLQCQCTGSICSWIHGDTGYGECAKIVPARQRAIVLRNEASFGDPVSKSLQGLAVSNFTTICRRVIDALENSERAQPLAEFGPGSTLSSALNPIHTPQHPKPTSTAA